jgi:hypothetical protein
MLRQLGLHSGETANLFGAEVKLAGGHLFTLLALGRQSLRMLPLRHRAGGLSLRKAPLVCPVSMKSRSGNALAGNLPVVFPTQAFLASNLQYLCRLTIGKEELVYQQYTPAAR